MRRLLNLDIAKAICIILVVIGHYTPEESPQWYIVLVKFIYTFHMPLFLFVSGYVYIAFKKEENYFHFELKKIKRLVIPYLTVSVIVITLKMLSQGSMYVQHPVTYLSYLKILYMPEAGFFLWFIWCLWLAFIIIPFFQTKSSRIILFAITVIISYLPIENTEIFALSAFAKMSKYFMLGIIVYDYHQFLLPLKRINFIPFAMTLAALFAIQLIFSELANMTLIVDITAVAGIATIYQLSTTLQIHQSKVSEVLIGVASSSYIIYLFHTTFEGLTKSILHKINISDANYVNLVFCIEAILIIFSGIIFPIIVHKYILSKNKILRFLFGL